VELKGVYNMSEQLKVTYVDHFGNDLRVVNSARISMNNKSSELAEKDIKLINYLAEHKHYSPFEHNSLTVLIECPIYIAAQIMRHRTGKFNMTSRRYTEDNIEFFEPEVYRKQHKKSKQCSDGRVDHTENDLAKALVKEFHVDALIVYNQLLSLGVSRELARGVLPQNLMTKFYMTMDLRNWVNFLILRLDEHAQEEARIIAQQIRDILIDKFPVSTQALLTNVK
jgi:thymidylate synthase (FAD)